MRFHCAEMKLWWDMSLEIWCYLLFCIQEITFFEQLPVRAWVAMLRASLRLYFCMHIAGGDFYPFISINQR